MADFIFQNMAYRATVYRTWLCTNRDSSLQDLYRMTLLIADLETVCYFLGNEMSKNCNKIFVWVLFIGKAKKKRTTILFVLNAAYSRAFMLLFDFPAGWPRSVKNTHTENE